MSDEKVLEGAETEILQIGVVVKDLDRTVEYLTAMGFGPFTIRPAVHPAARVHGKKRSYEVRLALSQQGPVQLELIEYLSGETVQKEFLDERGEGLHHIQVLVRDLDASIAKFADKNVQVLQEDRFVGGGGLAYMGTDEVGGIVTEIVQRPLEFDPEQGTQYVSE